MSRCWGQNSSGQLGLGDAVNRGDGTNEMGDNLPAVDLGNGRSAAAITAGANHTCALLDNGQVRCWGVNSPLGILGIEILGNRGDNPGELGENQPVVNLTPGNPTGFLLYYSVEGLVSSQVSLTATGPFRSFFTTNEIVSFDGSYLFNVVADNANLYAATVNQQPDGQNCAVANGSGTVNNANVTNIAISCSNDPVCVSPPSAIALVRATVNKPQFFASESAVTWSSSNTLVATVDSSNGVVTGVGRGSAVIIATDSGGSQASGTVTVIDYSTDIQGIFPRTAPVAISRPPPCYMDLML